jgi:hypothetical protein
MLVVIWHADDGMHFTIEPPPESLVFGVGMRRPSTEYVDPGFAVDVAQFGRGHAHNVAVFFMELLMPLKDLPASRGVRERKA